MLKVMEKKKGKGKKNNQLKLEVEDTHTFMNILKDELWEEKKVTLAAYSKSHPYLGNPVLLLKGKKLKKALKNAAKRVSTQAKDFQKEFSRKMK